MSLYTYLVASCLEFRPPPGIINATLLTLHNEKLNIVVLIIISECFQIKAGNVARLAKFVIRKYSKDV